MAPAKRFYFEFCNGNRASKTRIVPLPVHQSFDDISIRLDTLDREREREADRHRQTDRQKCRSNNAFCLHCMLPRDTNLQQLPPKRHGVIKYMCMYSGQAGVCLIIHYFNANINNNGPRGPLLH